MNRREFIGSAAATRSKVSKYNVVDATPFKRDPIEAQVKEILTQY